MRFFGALNDAGIEEKVFKFFFLIFFSIFCSVKSLVSGKENVRFLNSLDFVNFLDFWTSGPDVMSGRALGYSNMNFTY
jgi:hypothetical protein